MKNITPLGQLFVGLVNIRTEYEKIKADEEKKRSNTKLGWKAVVYSFWLIVFTALAVFIGKWGMQYLHNEGFIIGIVAMILALIFAIYIPIFLVFALSCSIKQIKLNKKPVGIVALIITLLLVVAAVVAAWLIIGRIK